MDGEGVSPPEAALPVPGVRVSGGGHAVGGEGRGHGRPQGDRALSEGAGAVSEPVHWSQLYRKLDLVFCK